MSAVISPKKDGEIQKVDIARQGKAVNFLKASENLKREVGRRSQLNTDLTATKSHPNRS
jgi:hypothetical protein